MNQLYIRHFKLRTTINTILSLSLLISSLMINPAIAKENDAAVQLLLLNKYDIEEPEKWDIIYEDFTQSTPLIIKDKKNVLVRNCTVQNIVDSHAIVIEDSENIRVENCVIDNVSGTEVRNSGIFITHSDKVVVHNNTITKIHTLSHSAGINMNRGCSNITISNNIIFDLWGNGIVSGGCSNPCATTQTEHDHPNPGLRIIGNKIHDIGLTPEPVAGSPLHGMYIKAQDPVVENNIVYNSFDGAGISLRSTSIARGNKVWDTKLPVLGLSQMKIAGPSGRSVIEDNILFQTDQKPGLLLGSAAPLDFGWKEGGYPLRYNNWSVQNNKMAVCDPGVEINTVNIKVFDGMNMTFNNNTIINATRESRLISFVGSTTSFTKNDLINASTTSMDIPANGELCNPGLILEHYEASQAENMNSIKHTHYK